MELVSVDRQDENSALNAPPRNASFGVLLRWHLRIGTRPRGRIGSPGRSWGVKEFADAIGLSDRSVRNWLNGEKIPTDLVSIERVLLGETVDRYSEEYLRACTELRDAHERTRHSLKGDLETNPQPLTQSELSDVLAIKLTVEQIRDEYRGELEMAKGNLHATEADLIGLLSHILQRRVAREDLLPSLEQTYHRLGQLRESISDIRHLSKEAPEIATLLKQVDAALSAGEAFSLDLAENALAEADRRYAVIVAEREDNVRRDKVNRAEILKKRADIALIKFDFAGAATFARQRYALLAGALGPEHAATVKSCFDLAAIIGQEGRLAEAEDILRAVVKSRERVPDPDDLHTAEIFTELAQNLSNQWRRAEAEPFFRKALAIRERIAGPEHLDTVASSDELAGSLVMDNCLTEAEPLLRRAVDIRERVLGPDHLDTATSYSKLAYLMRGQQRWHEAAALHRKVLEITEHALGPDHPSTAACYFNLAYYSATASMENLIEGEQLYRRALNIWERALGPTHPITATGYHGVGSILDQQGRKIEAEEFHRKTLDIWQQRYGPEHPETQVNCPRFRPDTRHKQEGSSTGLRTGLCLTSIDALK